MVNLLITFSIDYNFLKAKIILIHFLEVLNNHILSFMSQHKIMLNTQRTLIISENPTFPMINSFEDIIKLPNKQSSLKQTESENKASNENNIHETPSFSRNTRPDFACIAEKFSLTNSIGAINSYSRIDTTTLPHSTEKINSYNRVETVVLPNSLEKLLTSIKDKKFECSAMSRITSLKDRKPSHRNLRVKRKIFMLDRESEIANDQMSPKFLTKTQEAEKQIYPSENSGKYI